MNIKNKTGGFSLFEIIVAVCIMAVFTAVLIPSFIHAVNKARFNRDTTQFESVCVAFKRALGEPEVQKEIEELCNNEPFEVAFYADKNGVLEWGDGSMVGNAEYDFDTTQLWRNSYQTIGLRYETASDEHRGKYIVFNLVPKTATTTAVCEYEVVAVYP